MHIDSVRRVYRYSVSQTAWLVARTQSDPDGFGLLPQLILFVVKAFTTTALSLRNGCAPLSPITKQSILNHIKILGQDI
jgi:hypothetical protein